MRIHHPVSFCLAIGIMVATAGLAVVWNAVHLACLAVDLVAIVVLREVAHIEGRR